MRRVRPSVAAGLTRALQRCSYRGFVRHAALEVCRRIGSRLLTALRERLELLELANSDLLAEKRVARARFACSLWLRRIDLVLIIVRRVLLPKRARAPRK